jgi:endonuclease/exonuclease/phosphatase family metal-dependent hydrolase
MRRVGIILPKVFVRGLVILLLTLFLQLPNFAMAQELTVMTRNLYIGAEIQSLAAAPDIPAFIAGVQDALDQMAANDFTERAVALAAEIVDKNPHLVGLQEVYNLTSSIAALNGSPPFLDYQAVLIDALDAQGACYNVAATVTNLDFGPIPVPSYGLVSIADRDVILARCDVITTVVNLTPLCPALRQSMDGCNYQVVASANTPVGPIAFQRGYVGVDTLYGRFFNTHLEVRNPDPNNPYSPLVQRLQAMELIFVIDALNSVYPQPGPVIVVGDINSSPEDVDSIFETDSPYTQFVAEYADVWTSRPGKPKGFTCCYDEDLTIPADLYERIDMIFSSVEPRRLKATVVGNDEADQTSSGLWPSDHAGVGARIEFTP